MASGSIEQRYKVEITLTGEVRDADGNLLNTIHPVVEQEMTADEIEAFGLPRPDVDNT